MSEYVQVLRNSDLTLNPAGQNAECYRVYEAMAVGSVPVIEDTASCGTNEGVLRLLKQHKAPVIYVSHWHELPAILQNEQRLSPDEIIARRVNVVNWYRKFRRKMRDSFVRVVHHKFFDN